MTHLNSTYLQFLWWFILPQFFMFFLVLLVFGGEPKQKGKRAEESSDPFKIHLLERCVTASLAVLTTIVLLVSSYAMYDVIEQCIEDSKKPVSEEFSLPVKDPADVYPQGPGSLLRFFALNHYNLKDTTAESEDQLRVELFDLLSGNKESHTCFSLPEGFEVREAKPCSDFKIVGSIAEYNEQIIDARQKTMDTTRSDRSYQYRRIGVSALNCLDLLSNQCGDSPSLRRKSWDDFMYYGELAVWALANEYIYGNHTDAGKVDLFYRLAQAYDHVGTAATDEDPPFQHELYFISGAFLELSFRALEKINFEDRGQEYRSAVWDLYMTMHVRMGEYANDHEGFFQKVTDCGDKVKKGVRLTKKESGKIQEHLDDVADWKWYHYT